MIEPEKDTPFGRVVTAMVTPFDGDGALNLDVAQELAVHLEANDSEGLVVAGSTGESFTLSDTEKIDLVRAVYDAVKIPVLAGTGSSSTKSAVDLTKKITDLECADGFLVISPYGNLPHQEGIIDYFKTVAASTDQPMVMYNVPARTGVNMAKETISRLAEIDNIVGLKDAAYMSRVAIGSLENYIGRFPENFVYSGDDDKNLYYYRCGAAGTISVISHWAGNEIAQMFDIYDKDSLSKANDFAYKLEDSCSFASSYEPNPHPVKAMMRVAGFAVGKCRSPMYLPDQYEVKLEEHAARVLRELKN